MTDLPDGFYAVPDPVRELYDPTADWPAEPLPADRSIELESIDPYMEELINSTEKQFQAERERRARAAARPSPTPRPDPCPSSARRVIDDGGCWLPEVDRPSVYICPDCGSSYITIWSYGHYAWWSIAAQLRSCAAYMIRAFGPTGRPNITKEN